MDQHAMANAMVGREMSDLFPDKLSTPGEVALEVRGLSVPGFSQDVTFTLRRGEVLGVAGLIGSGRTETFEGLCGLRPATGDVHIFGQPVRIDHPWQAQDLGLCYLTEDRKTRGLLLNWLVTFVGNCAGAVATAGLMFYTTQYSFGAGAVGLAALTTANSKAALGFVPAFTLGIMCNALVCLASWMCYSARTTVDLAVPFSPRTRTPPTAGETAFTTSASRRSSRPTTAVKG